MDIEPIYRFHVYYDMNESSSLPPAESVPRTLKSLVNTPWKKAMLGVQLLSYVLLGGAPFIGGAIGSSLGLEALKTGGLILGVFLAGKVLMYGSLAFLGKEVLLVIRDKVRSWFKRRK